VKPIYTLDTETDPFSYGRIPKVFCCGLYDGETFRFEWGKDCMKKMRDVLLNLPPGIIYVHNGGRFDFYYMLDWFDGPMMIINSRVIKAQGLGHEWRDSCAIYPMALKSYKKDDIDYAKLESKERNKHKAEIIDYLRGDCVYLHELCSKFCDEFGDNLTIGGTSMKQLRKLHKFETLEAEHDALIRSKYYFGGRVQCFEKGIIVPSKGERLYCYDINQSYPNSMRSYLHPIGSPTIIKNASDISIGRDTYFLSVFGYSSGCFPVRDNDGGLSFPIGLGIYHVSIHEYNAAIETNQFELQDILQVVNFDKSGSFGEFVDTYHGLRKQAKLNGDELGSTFYKLVCNSAYGKFAQCPDNYMEYIIKPLGVDVFGYTEDYIVGNSVLWSKPSEDVTRYNVATGASITGCSRSFLIRALATAKRPIYCDTDSIICEELGPDTEYDDTKIGAWKLEKSGDKIAIAGKKLYAMFDGIECIKMASKGVRLTAAQIEYVATGGKVTWKKDAPTFSLSCGTRFLHRNVVMS
jgi:hypothetical protein